MLKIAILGCGKIADAHAAQIQRIKDCEIVAVCDREELMARQLCERFSVGKYFSDLDKMLKEMQPNVVHITTPPQSHFELAKTCLEHGCHVYVEKPFTLNYDDTKTLIALAERENLKLTAGHDAQFTHAARRLRHKVADGILGGPAVHIESYYCYELGNDSYARALLSDQDHWVRKLPGKLLHNIISHGVSRIAEHLSGEEVEVVVNGFVSSALRARGERSLIDELRVIIRDQNDTTAYFTFSSQMRPLLRQLRVFGPKNGLLLDDDEQTLVRLRGKRFKSYAEKFLPPLFYTWEYGKNLFANLGLFVSRDFQMKSGMKTLIELFYRSITDGTPVPISYREIRLTSKIMDQIFTALSDETDNSDRIKLKKIACP